MRIAYRPVDTRASVARQREIIHDQRRDDFRARVEHPCNDRRVALRHISLQYRRPAAGRYAGYAYAVLHSHAAALERTARGALDAASGDDRVQGIVFRRRALA